MAEGNFYDLTKRPYKKMPLSAGTHNTVSIKPDACMHVDVSEGKKGLGEKF